MVWQSLTGRSRLSASCQGVEYARARENCHPWGEWQTPSIIYCPWENVGLLLELRSGSPWEVSATVLWLGKLFLAFGWVVVIYGHLSTRPCRHQRGQLVTSCLVARCSGGEEVGFSDRLWEVAKALAPNQCGLDSIPGVDGLSLLLAFFSAPRFSLPGYSGFLIS